MKSRNDPIGAPGTRRLGWFGILFLLALAGLTVRAADESAVTNAPPPAAEKPAADAKVEAEPRKEAAETEEQKKERRELQAKERRVRELLRRIPGLFKDKRYAEARDRLIQLTELVPEDENSFYNLACAQARLNETNEAMKSLNVAIEKGWADFRHIEKDADLEPLRTLPEYRKLLTRREEIQKKRADKIHERMVSELGTNYLYGINHDLRLVYATDVDQRTLKEMEKMLTTHARALQEDVFSHGFERYLTVIIPRKWENPVIGGFYNDDNELLTAQDVGLTLRHEFTHALHFADQKARGQEHNYWVIEGFSSLYESSKVQRPGFWRRNVWNPVVSLFGGDTDARIHAVPQDNNRLAVVQDRVRQKKHVPWADFMKLDPRNFMRRAGENYGQARYILFYLHDQNKLRAWYDAYVDLHEEDPTGAKAMEKVFEKPLADIEKDWTAWVLARPAPLLRLPSGHAGLGIVTDQANDGVRIARLLPDGGAEKSGLLADDILIRVEENRIYNQEDLMYTINGRGVGEEVRVEYRRGEAYKVARVKLTELPSEPGEKKPEPKPEPAAPAPAAKAEEPKTAP